MGMSVVKDIDRLDFFSLLEEGLESELLDVEEIMYRLIIYKCGVLCDDQLILNDCMRIMESHT